MQKTNVKGRVLAPALAFAAFGALLVGCAKTEPTDTAASPAAGTTTTEGSGTSATTPTTAAPSAAPAGYQGNTYGGQVAKPE